MPIRGVTGLTDLSGRTLKMLEEQLGMEERIADTYSYYSSQAGNPALSTMLNQFVREKAREMEALRGLIGERGKRTDAFEEQVYQNQAGGPNPGGSRRPLGRALAAGGPATTSASKPHSWSSAGMNLFEGRSRQSRANLRPTPSTATSRG
jgi:hypothetical protein